MPTAPPTMKPTGPTQSPTSIPTGPTKSPSSVRRQLLRGSPLNGKEEVERDERSAEAEKEARDTIRLDQKFGRRSLDSQSGDAAAASRNSVERPVRDLAVAAAQVAGLASGSGFELRRFFADGGVVSLVPATGAVDHHSTTAAAAAAAAWVQPRKETDAATDVNSVEANEPLELNSLLAGSVDTNVFVSDIQSETASIVSLAASSSSGSGSAISVSYNVIIPSSVSSSFSSLSAASSALSDALVSSCQSGQFQQALYQYSTANGATNLANAIPGVPVFKSQPETTSSSTKTIKAKFKKLSTGAIIGIAVGVGVLVLCCLACLVFYTRQKQKNKAHQRVQPLGVVPGGNSSSPPKSAKRRSKKLLKKRSEEEQEEEEQEEEGGDVEGISDAAEGISDAIEGASDQCSCLTSWLGVDVGKIIKVLCCLRKVVMWLYKVYSACKRRGTPATDDKEEEQQIQGNTAHQRVEPVGVVSGGDSSSPPKYVKRRKKKDVVPPECSRKRRSWKTRRRRRKRKTMTRSK